MSWIYQDLINEAEAAEQAGDYKTAIQKYEQALDNSLRISRCQVKKNTLRDRIIELKLLNENTVN